MGQTANFQLKQWELTDRILMEDFNSDNQKIDAALGNMLKIASGTYTGAGTYGSGNKNTLTFDFPPKIVFIMANSDSSPAAGVVLLQGQTKSAGSGANYSSFSLELTVSWNGNSVSWYSARSADRQLNTSSLTYHYAALG